MLVLLFLSQALSYLTKAKVSFLLKGVWVGFFVLGGFFWRVEFLICFVLLVSNGEENQRI